MSDKKLREASLAIAKVMKEYDVMGAVIIANGQGEGDYLLNFADPTWSQFALSETTGTIVFKGRFKDPEEEKKTNRTINALWVVKDLLAIKAVETRKLGEQLKTKFEILEDNNQRMFRQDGTLTDEYPKPEEFQG